MPDREEKRLRSNDFHKYYPNYEYAFNLLVNVCYFVVVLINARLCACLGLEPALPFFVLPRSTLRYNCGFR